MAGALGRFTFKLVTALVAIPVSRLITKGTQKAWKTARPEDPIHDPKKVDTRWHDALVWAGLTGVGTALGSLVSAKGADTVWRAATGRPSPRPKPPKQKKQSRLQKAKRDPIENVVLAGDHLGRPDELHDRP